MNIAKFVNDLIAKGVKFPIPKYEAKKYRGIGKVALTKLISMGFVSLDPLPEKTFSTRSENILRNANWTTAEDVKRAHSSGYFRPGNPHNCGWKSYVEICKWAGITPVAKSKTMILCPCCGKQFFYSQAKFIRPNQ